MLGKRALKAPPACPQAREVTPRPFRSPKRPGMPLSTFVSAQPALQALSPLRQRCRQRLRRRRRAPHAHWRDDACISVFSPVSVVVSRVRVQRVF